MSTKKKIMEILDRIEELDADIIYELSKDDVDDDYVKELREERKRCEERIDSECEDYYENKISKGE